MKPLLQHPSFSMVNDLLKNAVLNRNQFSHSAKFKIVNVTGHTERRKKLI